ncbi:hypothetical protein [Streptomyces sp. NPDC001774]
MQTFNFLPSGDVDNDGWVLGGAITRVWEALSTFADDTKYVRPPAYRGGATVSFPIDTTTLPEGAVIDSVTVNVRLKYQSGSASSSVTINLMSSDNMSRYTSRTITDLSSSFTTVTLGTYATDALGFAWDVHRLNKLRLRAFCLNNLADAVRISGLWITVNYHVRPTVILNGPSGTITTPSPTFDWTYRQTEGEPQASAEVRVFAASQLDVGSAYTFHPEIATPRATASVSGQASTVTLASSLPPEDYVAWVLVRSQHGAKSLWSSKAFTVTGSSPGVPGDDNAGVSGTPGVGLPTVTPDSETSSSTIVMRDSSNLLSVNQADFEISTDPIEVVGTNATVARSTAAAFGLGVASLSITASSTSNAVATFAKAEVVPGAPITVRGQWRTAVTARTVQLQVKFYDHAHTLLGGTLSGTGTDSTSTWTEVVVTGTSPVSDSALVYAEVVATVQSPAASEVHYLDHVGLMYGTGTGWSDGGHASRNLLSSFLATGNDPAPASDAWVAANVATTLSRPSVSGTGSHGDKVNRMTYAGTSTSIGFRATSTVFTSASAGTGFTLNKPAGLANNDLMLAFVTSTEHGSIVPPAGWSTVNTASVDDGSTDVALWVLKRTGFAADPSTWTDGVVSVSSSRRTAVVVAYSGAAHADEQFIAENVRTDDAGVLVHQTAQVANNDPNAWRVSAFAAHDNVSGGAWTANVLPPVIPQIQFVGRGAKWSSSSLAYDYVINKPAGVVSGDLMIASFLTVGNITTVNAPSGWTTVRKVVAGSNDFTMVVFKRTAGSSEPASWTASCAGQPFFPAITECSAYRNAATAASQFIAENTSSVQSNSTITTASVTNTSSSAMRVSVFGASRNLFNPTPTFTSSEVAERSDDYQDWTGGGSQSYGVNLAMYDSNGPVSTGSHSRTGTFSANTFIAAASWIGLIQPLAGSPPSGPNETERVDNSNGASSSFLYTTVHDSNAVIGTGLQSVYGTMTPGSGTSSESVASWIGIVKPATATEAGLVEAYPNTTVDISDLDPTVLDLCDRKVTLTAQFIGSTSGVPRLSVDFFRANQLISSVSAAGTTFGSSVYAKSWVTFDIPDGTTRIRPKVGATGRAVSGTVDFTRIGLMLGAPADGTDVVWRNGTARPEHPVWARPEIEYADDEGAGFGDWVTLSGQVAYPPAFAQHDQSLTYLDHTVVPLYDRRYRVRTLSYGLAGDRFVSPWGPASASASFSAETWWLKDIQDATANMPLTVKWESVSVATSNTSAVFQPLGSDYAVVVSEGFRSDTFEIKVWMDRFEYAELKALFRRKRTLFLQSDVDHGWWVRPIGDVPGEILPTSKRKTNPLRWVTLRFAEVAPEL